MVQRILDVPTEQLLMLNADGVDAEIRNQFFLLSGRGTLPMQPNAPLNVEELTLLLNEGHRRLLPIEHQALAIGIGLASISSRGHVGRHDDWTERTRPHRWPGATSGFPHLRDALSSKFGQTLGGI